MEATAKVTGVRITPRKVKLVIDLVRGKNVADALGILANVNKSATVVVTKLIKSAAANAVNNNKMDESKLYIKTIYANEGPRLKRYLPRAKGSADSLIKRTSHITCVVAER
ncbi:MAG: 50S ribosomal protein L22 [Bacillales bacterium]|nr:50S ribosomal protein L22 [Bacillales bacterium]